nr:5089_t:CDS:2 [Entrophospora candida]
MLANPLFPSGIKKLYNEGRVIYEFSILSWLTKKTSFFALEVSTRAYQDLYGRNGIVHSELGVILTKVDGFSFINS